VPQTSDAGAMKREEEIRNRSKQLPHENTNGAVSKGPGFEPKGCPIQYSEQEARFGDIVSGRNYFRGSGVVKG